MFPDSTTRPCSLGVPAGVQISIEGDWGAVALVVGQRRSRLALMRMRKEQHQCLTTLSRRRLSHLPTRAVR